MLGIILWIVFGWVTGSIAEWLWPPATPSSRWQTIAVGVVGSIVGGVAGSLVSGDSYHPAGMVMSVVGAIACSAIWRKLDEVQP